MGGLVLELPPALEAALRGQGWYKYLFLDGSKSTVTTRYSNKSIDNVEKDFLANNVTFGFYQKLY